MTQSVKRGEPTARSCFFHGLCSSDRISVNEAVVGSGYNSSPQFNHEFKRVTKRTHSIQSQRVGCRTSFRDVTCLARAISWVPEPIHGRAKEV